MSTMTTINDINDLARILRERPDWLETVRGLVVGAELLSLPQQLAEFVAATNENFRLVNERLSQLEERLDEFIAATNENFRLVNERLGRLETDVSDVSELKGDVSELKDGQARLEGRFSNMEGRFNSMEGRFSNFEGRDYERSIRNRLLFRATHWLNLSNPTIAMVQDAQSSPAFSSAVHRAIRSNTISIEQAEDLHEADIIISDPDNRHVLAEVAITADNDDIARALRRAGILTATTGGQVIPAVVTTNIAEPQQALAEENDVVTFVIPYSLAR